MVPSKTGTHNSPKRLQGYGNEDAEREKGDRKLNQKKRRTRRERWQKRTIFLPYNQSISSQVLSSGGQARWGGRKDEGGVPHAPLEADPRKGVRG